MDLVERRRAPRFDVALSGTAITSSNHRCKIEVSNISSSGLQFNVDQFEIPNLFPTISEQNAMQPIQLELAIQLPSEADELRIKCGIVYLQRQSVDKCIVGCRFEEFVGQCNTKLENFILQLSNNDSSKKELLEEAE
ncbi:MAG: PilZ domain-containing protein [Kangiellaceae bacterium]|nr:PilZ domain-containing protein [Kangiellaceae bacterium]MCW8999299.1 PilZ domain-containing protein [Kangiellaceae bacterium]MCW9015985.1 PilZ domain-containing protein [Kangiellaceae bacterium]